MVKLRIVDDGNKFWYLNAAWHRVNGPAITLSNDCLEWYCRGQRHRADGPAIVSCDGTLYWYWNGQRVTEYEHMMLSEQETTNG